MEGKPYLLSMSNWDFSDLQVKFEQNRPVLDVAAEFLRERGMEVPNINVFLNPGVQVVVDPYLTKGQVAMQWPDGHKIIMTNLKQ